MRFIIIGLLALVISQSAQAAGVTAEFSQVGESLHLEFKGLNQWDYNIDKKLDKTSTTFEIEIPHLSEPGVMALKQWKNPLVESMNIRHDGADGKDVVAIKIKSKNLEAFDYLTDQPSRLIIDIYESPANLKPAKTEAAAVPVVDAPKKDVKKKTLAVTTKKAKRAPSSADFLAINNQGPIEASGGTTEAGVSKSLKDEEKLSGIFDGGDPNFERFQIKDYEIKEDSIIASRENYYIDFPMLRTESDELTRLRAKAPVYEVTPEDTDENKQVRLLITLFENKRYNVFIKAVDWFTKKYPESKYGEIVRYMWADTHFNMWMQTRDPNDFDLAMTRYRQAIDKNPQSLLMERTRMLMGFASLDRGDYLGTLRLFQQHIRELPDSPNKDIARMAIADAFLKLGSFKDSEDMYHEIEKGASDKKYQIAAAFMVGDVAYQNCLSALSNEQNQFLEKSIEQYKSALAKYPEGAKDYPNALYNQAAANFKLGKPREAMRTYIDFLKMFPSHDYAGYAMTRVGELLDMMGADKSRSVGAYLETQFRYGENPSSLVARLRLVSSRMHNMKQKELDRAIEDITAMAKKSGLPNIEQFSNVLISDGFASRGEYENAIKLLVKYYQAHPTTADRQLIDNRIVKNINSEIKTLVDDGKYIQALRVHNQYADNRLKGSDRVDTMFNVGRAFEQAGVFNEAEKLYRDSLNKMIALKGTKDEKQRNIFERLPSIDEVELRLASTELQLGQNVPAYEHMKAIKNPEALTETQQIERVQLGSKLYEGKGDLNSATRYLVELINQWKGIPALVADPYLQLADLEIKQGKKDDAVQSLQKIDQMMKDSQNTVPSYVHYKALEQLGNIYFEKNQTPKAIETYERLLKLYEGSKPLASIRYKLGNIYFQKGELQKAADTWNGLKNEKSTVWYDLAQEQLKNSDWNNEYKKYIKRIPAMSERN